MAATQNDPQNSPKSDPKKSAKHAKEKKRSRWKGYRVSGFLYNVFISIAFVVTLSMFLYCIYKGTPEAYETGRYWLFGALASGAFGVVALYQYYVIKPAQEIASAPKS